MSVMRPAAASALGTTALRGWRAGAVWLVVVLDLVAMVAGLLIAGDLPDMPGFASAIYVYLLAAFGVVGAMVVTRQPRNPVGWILSWVATTLALVTFGQYYAAVSLRAFDGGLPGTVPMAWLSQLPFTASIATVVVILPMTFPDGRLLSRRWRPVAWLAIGAIVATALPVAFQPGPIPNNEAIANPMGSDVVMSLVGPLATLGWVVLVGIAFPLSIVSVVLRYRRGSATERLQLRWFAAAVALSLTIYSLGMIPLDNPLLGDVFWVLGILSLPLLPIAIGVAILRYHLYEIDRIISRTIGYAVVTATLGLVFAAAILIFEGVLAPLTRSNTVAVAASTLVVVALFQPLRRRVQRIADHRFNRSHYDAERTVTAFSARLRDDVDLGSLRDDVVDVAARTVSPASVGLWVRHPVAAP